MKNKPTKDRQAEILASICQSMVGYSIGEVLFVLPMVIAKLKNDATKVVERELIAGDINVSTIPESVMRQLIKDAEDELTITNVTLTP